MIEAIGADLGSMLLGSLMGGGKDKGDTTITQSQVNTQSQGLVFTPVINVSSPKSPTTMGNTPMTTNQSPTQGVVVDDTPKNPAFNGSNYALPSTSLPQTPYYDRSGDYKSSLIRDDSNSDNDLYIYGGLGIGVLLIAVIASKKIKKKK